MDEEGCRRESSKTRWRRDYTSAVSPSILWWCHLCKFDDPAAEKWTDVSDVRHLRPKETCGWWLQHHSGSLPPWQQLQISLLRAKRIGDRWIKMLWLPLWVELVSRLRCVLTCRGRSSETADTWTDPFCYLWCHRKVQWDAGRSFHLDKRLSTRL